MNKKIIVTILCVFAFQLSFSQEKYVPGYIIQLNGATTKGFVDYRNWEKNPSTVFFKEENSSEKNGYTPKDILGFGVQGELYKSALVKTEVSLENKPLTNQFSNDLTFQTDTTFVQALFEGEKSLYYYKSSYGNENFYIKQDGEYELLIYKKYVTMVEGSNKIMENKKFLGQLALYLQESSTIDKPLAKTKYTINSLEKLFQYYYEHTNFKIEFQRPGEKAKTEFGALAGVTLTNMKVGSNNSFFDYLTTVDLSQSTNFTGGLFFEIVLPKNHGKWSVNNELIFTSYETQGHYEAYTDANNYTYIDSKFGVSHIKLNNMVRFRYPIKKISLFFNGGLSNGVTVQETNYKKTERKFFSTHTVTEGEALANTKKYELGYLFGLGVRFSKFSLEARREANINGLTPAVSLSTSVIRYYFVLGYRF